MATSRRRERELARRRYERRLQAEAERRAKAKRRNTIIGAVIGTAVVIAVLLTLTFTVFTGGSNNKSVKAASTPSASPSASASPTADPAPPAKCATIAPNPPAKGEPVIPTPKPAKGLVTKDIKVGHGAAAKTGSSVTVKYVGISCSTGKVFDASYTDGAAHKELPAFPLGQHQVIEGWDQGLIGMKVGGVRELVIPPSLGYGATGSGSTIKPNEWLIFVVTMDKIA